jgi:hypothetical protein
MGPCFSLEFLITKAILVSTFFFFFPQVEFDFGSWLNKPLIPVSNIQNIQNGQQ